MCATTAPTCSSRSARWAEGASAGFSTAPPLHAIAILPCVQYYLQLPIVVTPASAPSLRTSIPINRYGLSDQLMVIGGKVASTCLVSPVGPSAGSQFAAISAGAHRWSRPHVHQTINGSAGLDRHGRIGMRVSVVIPVHNRQILCERALRSALAQCVSRLETIIVDDGSRPPFQLPADLAGTPNIRIIRHDRNRGPAAARNTGVDTARGEW